MNQCEHHEIHFLGKQKKTKSSFVDKSKKKTDLFNFRRYEAADVTGSSLTLAAAGSRRTVYLIDDKLPDSANTSTTSAELTSPSPNSSNNRNNASNNNHDQAPNTILMYNRISNVIGEPKIQGNGSENVTNGNVSKDKKKPDDERAIWYEYGCV